MYRSRPRPCGPLRVRGGGQTEGEDKVSIMMERVTALLIFAMLAPPTAFAQQLGEIGGRIISARDSEPLRLAQVDLVGTAFSAVTTDDGAFRISGVPAGTYTLRASLVGYRVIQQAFTLAAGELKTFEVVLTPSTITLTDTAVVTADPFQGPEVTSTGFILQGDEQKNLASVLADDPLRAVQDAPGVTSNDDFSSEFSVRGAPFDRIGVYLDGVLLHSPFHTTDGQADNGSLTVFNGDLLDQMTLYQGAWPVRYADRTAGLLSVETRQGTRQDFRSQVSASASNASYLAEGPVGPDKRGAWLFAIRKSYLQYILNRIDLGDQPPFAFGFTDGEGRLDYDVTSQHALSLTFLDGTSNVDRTRFRAKLGPNSVMTSTFRFTLVNLRERYTARRLLVTSGVAWSRETGHVENHDISELSNQTYVLGTARVDATLMLTTRDTLDFGGDYRHVRQQGVSTQFVYAPQLTSSLDAFTGSANEGGVYVQESLVLSKTKFTGGARRDEHSLQPSQAAQPYASLSYDVSNKTRLEFDWGRYEQFAELNQVFSRFAAGPLRPEHATHYDVSIERRLDTRTRLRLELYDRQDHDLLARPLIDPRLAPNGIVINARPDAPLVNSEYGYARGAEVVVQRRTANGFTGWVSYAYGRAILRDDVLALTFPSDYDQRHTVNLYVSRRLRPTVNFSGHFTYGSGMPLPGFYRLDNGVYDLAQVRNDLRAPRYERADVRVNKEYVRRTFDAMLFAEVVNVTNHANRDFDSAGPYDPATGRSTPNFYSMFPILPSVGMVVTFGHGHKT